MKANNVYLQYVKFLGTYVNIALVSYIFLSRMSCCLYKCTMWFDQKKWNNVVSWSCIYNSDITKIMKCVRKRFICHWRIFIFKYLKNCNLMSFVKTLFTILPGNHWTRQSDRLWRRQGYKCNNSISSHVVRFWNISWVIMPQYVCLLLERSVCFFHIIHEFQFQRHLPKCCY